MASDSDLEAYLNQLSRKTNILKQDANDSDNISSRLSSPEDRSSNTEDFSGKSELHLREKNCKVGQLVTTNDITALSEKYSQQTSKKALSHDEFSNIERKYRSYTKKPVSKVPSQEEGHGAKDRFGDDDKFSQPRTTGNKRESKSYDDSSVDDELARYLEESSISDTEGNERKYGKEPRKSISADSSVEDESDDVLNLNNIITMEDIMGQLSEDADYPKLAQEDFKPLEGQHSGFHDKIEESVLRKEITDRKPNSSRKKSIVEKDNISSASKDNPSGSSEALKKLMRKSSVSLFYPDAEVDDEDHAVDKLEGVLFTEVNETVYHSSRRNSLIAPMIKRKSSSKSLVSLSIQDQADDDGDGTSSHSSAESVIEKLSFPCESSVAESVAERNSSDNVASKYSEDFEGSENEKSNKNETINPIEIERKSLPKTISQQVITRKSVTDGEEKNYLSIHSGRGNSDDDAETNSKEEGFNASCDEDKHDIGKTHNKSSKTKNKREKKSSRKARQKSKRKERIRTSSSSSSSSRKYKKKGRRNRRSRSSSSCTSESYKEAYRKYKTRKHRHKKNKYMFNPLEVGPYMYPWWWVRSHQHSSLAAAASFPFPHQRTMEGWQSVGGFIGIDDILKQQVLLTRQFMDSQQALYHAYTATLTSSYRYTSLKDTEKYIKKKKHPITFDEAYRLVKEEMKSTRKKE